MRWKVNAEDVRALLAELAEEAWGLAPLPEIAALPGGKPYFPSHPNCQFNLSHSGNLGLCAVSEHPIGADIEQIRPRRKTLPRYVLDGREFDWYRTQGSTWGDFYTLWTLKEARVKCTGEGLRRPAREIAVPLLLPGESALWAGFYFTALAGEGWRGAICEKGSTL
ncbi:MAG: 4'-phosphopantetheinyl transferase superfamily protein [Pseudoflavonifractor sp.]|nr:4'-phosphopantetheinyl transferase superfamily protein [Pseudoflavonifractor sp.]